MCAGDTGCHKQGVAPGIQWAEGRHATKHPTIHRSAPPQEVSIQPQMLIGPRLRKPTLTLSF